MRVAGQVDVVVEQKLERRQSDEIFILRVELLVDDGDAATRAASSQALARANASSAGFGAGAAFDLADFSAATARAGKSSGTCCAKAAMKIAGKSRSKGRRKCIATKSSPFDRPLRRRIDY
jgi:hypothetical protein